MLGALELDELEMVSAGAAEKVLVVLLSILCSLFFRNWSITCSAWKDARNSTQSSNVDGLMSS